MEGRREEQRGEGKGTERKQTDSRGPNKNRYGNRGTKRRREEQSEEQTDPRGISRELNLFYSLETRIVTSRELDLF
jgi:hypothetical protein